MSNKDSHATRQGEALRPTIPVAKSPDLTLLFNNSIALIRHAREIVTRQVNVVQLMTYYILGCWIVEAQQSGEARAKYGEKIIQTLSDRLTVEFGKGFSADTLEKARRFYLCYQTRISATVLRKFTEGNSETLSRFFEKSTPFTLSWSHYLLLTPLPLTPADRRADWRRTGRCPTESGHTISSRSTLLRRVPKRVFFAP